jgi:phosphomannomutase/phosphoglucomutase
MNNQIFREYDIRGIIDKELNRDVALQIGKALGTSIKGEKTGPVVVGRDMRRNSKEMSSGVIEGLLSTGWDVVDVGLVPTPLLYFSLFHLNAAGGVMITGSHNPPEFNGFKVCVGKWAISGSEIQEIRKIIEKGDFAKGKGKSTPYCIYPHYMNRVCSQISLKKKLKVVVDAGNGTGGIVAPELLSRLGCEVIELYCKPDGSFPNHFADPTVPENLNDLIATVKKTGADAGIAYDGDADRIGVVDEKGNILFGDQLLILFARDILEKKPGAKIVFEVKCSQNLVDDIRKNGGIPIMSRTGHSPIKKRMKQEHAVLGGEMSGHMFFADDYYGYDDAIYASARLLQLLAKSNKKLLGLLQDIPKTYATPEIRIDCPDEIKFRLVDSVKDYFKDHYEVIDIDGVRVIFPDGWGLLRASNTQPVLVLRFEAQSEERLKEIKDLFLKKLEEMGDLKIEV